MDLRQILTWVGVAMLAIALVSLLAAIVWVWVVSPPFGLAATIWFFGFGGALVMSLRPDSES